MSVPRGFILYIHSFRNCGILYSFRFFFSFHEKSSLTHVPTESLMYVCLFISSLSLTLSSYSGLCGLFKHKGGVPVS